MEKATILLQRTLEGVVDKAHGIDHALQVVKHVDKALEVTEYQLTDVQKEAIRLAALLHDADDGKFFTDSSNASDILSEVATDEVKELTLRMIDLVSCSKNGNSVVEPDWLLYPRYADRLEAIGEIGIQRCWEYSSHVKREAFDANTKRARNPEELYEIVTYQRFNNYVKLRGKMGNASFIDHFYDKLLHIGKVGNNSYFNELAKERIKIMEGFVIEFGITGKIPMRDYMQ